MEFYGQEEYEADLDVCQRAAAIARRMLLARQIDGFQALKVLTALEKQEEHFTAKFRMRKLAYAERQARKKKPIHAQTQSEWKEVSFEEAKQAERNGQSVRWRVNGERCEVQK